MGAGMTRRMLPMGPCPAWQDLMKTCSGTRVLPANLALMVRLAAAERTVLAIMRPQARGIMGNNCSACRTDLPRISLSTCATLRAPYLWNLALAVASILASGQGGGLFMGATMPSEEAREGKFSQ